MVFSFATLVSFVSN